MGSANEQSSSGWTWSTTLVVLLISYPFLQSLYYLYLHPLSRIPGSPLWSSSRLPFLVSVARGNLTRDLAAMHKRYGPILRIAPDEVTFTHPDAWNDIMVPQPGRAPFLKHPIWWKPLPGTPPSLISSIDPEQHAHFRRCFAPAFTSRALRSQEPVLQEYVDLLMRRLRDQIYDGDAKPGEERKEAAAAEVDIWRWYNFFTFDAFSHLALGESFNCLDRGAYHGWIVLIFDYAKALAALVAVRFFPIPGTDAFLSRLLPPSIVRAQQAHFQLIVDRVRRRLDRGGDPARPDVMSFLHIEGEGHDDEAEDIAPSADDDGYGRDKKEKLTLDVVNASFSELVLAGSESTGLVLTGAVNYLIHNPDKLAVVVDEVRARFASYQDITFDALRDAAYLNAVLSEALRLCPTLQWISPRQVPKGGATVCGRWLPGGTAVSMSASALQRDPALFHDASSFHPERWLLHSTSATSITTGTFAPANPAPESSESASPFSKDRLDAVKPFIAGPRTCIGMNLAWAEMRLALAKLLWVFDISAPEAKTEAEQREKWVRWEDLNATLLVEKRPILVVLKPRDGVGVF